MRHGRFPAVVRLAVAALSLAAVGTQLGVTLSQHHSVVNFFSYFTNLGNLMADAALIAGAVRVLRGAPETVLGSTLRGAARPRCTSCSSAWSSAPCCATWTSATCCPG